MELCFVKECHWQYRSMLLMYVVATYPHGLFSSDMRIGVAEGLNILNLNKMATCMCGTSEVIL
jgi:hypothetical protein